MSHYAVIGPRKGWRSDGNILFQNTLSDIEFCSINQFTVLEPDPSGF
jgi:hypothetical protein